LVTPTSQLVGIQAVMNVLSGKRYGMVPNEIKDYARGLYCRPPAEIDPKIKKKIIGDEQPITVRPADMLEPALDRIPEDVKPLIETEEDKITYALFPQIAVDFFKKRKAKKTDPKAIVPPEKLSELEDVAAVAATVATYVTSTNGLKALTLTLSAPKGRVSPWVLAGRESLAERGA